MIKLIMFEALLCLGAAPELKIHGLEPQVHTSKHHNKSRHRLRRGKAQVKTWTKAPKIQNHIDSL